MKWIAALLCLQLASPSAYGQTEMTLREHMYAMGYLIDEVFALSDQPENYVTVAEKTRELRGHLTKSVALLPENFTSLSDIERNSSTVEYHQMMARAIYLTASLEETLLASEHAQFQSGSKKEDVQNLLYEINVLIGKAHGRFRD